MAWRRPGDKPLSEPMLVRSLTHIWNLLGQSSAMNIMRKIRAIVHVFGQLASFCDCRMLVLLSMILLNGAVTEKHIVVAYTGICLNMKKRTCRGSKIDEELCHKTVKMYWKCIWLCKLWLIITTSSTFSFSFVHSMMIYTLVWWILWDD